MAGTKYSTKQALIDAFKLLIYPNKEKKITGANHQQSGLDIIESLWQEGPVGGCSTETFTGTAGQDVLNVTIDRIVCGTDITISIKVDSSGITQLVVPYDDEQVTIQNVIPQDFGGFSWFHPKSGFAVISSVDPPLEGDFGVVKFSDLSSYQSGASDIGDESALMITGNTKGMNRAFSFSTPDSNFGLYDVEETHGVFNNYLTNSPKDLTIGGLDITIGTIASHMNDTNYKPAKGVYVFELKGTLIK
jgi:hypothetical protein